MSAIAWLRGTVCAATVVATAASAIGLGPLQKAGFTDSERKGFYLTVINPYSRSERFSVRSAGWDDDVTSGRVRIIPAELDVAAGSQRQILVIVNDLVPGETYKFRVCGALASPPRGGLINARVCSKLTARRLAEPVHTASLRD